MKKLLTIALLLAVAASASALDRSPRKKKRDKKAKTETVVPAPVPEAEPVPVPEPEPAPAEEPVVNDMTLGFSPEQTDSLLAAWRERQRQDGRVGAGRELAHRKVGQHERHENAQRHPEGVHGQGLAVVQRQHGERQHHQGSGHAQEDELDVAARHEDAPPCAPPDVPPPVDPPAEAAS